MNATKNSNHPSIQEPTTFHLSLNWQAQAPYGMNQRLVLESYVTPIRDTTRDETRHDTPTREFSKNREFRHVGTRYILYVYF